MKKFILIEAALMLSAAQLLAQRIDFNMSGRQEKEGLAPGYTAWTFGRVTSDTQKFLIPNTTDSVTITISAVEGLEAGNGIRTNYWKQGVVNYGYKLVGDMALVTQIDSDNNSTEITSGSSGLQLVIEGLPAGEHTLMAYHSNTDNIGENVAPLDVLVNGQTIAAGVKQRARGVTPSQCPFSYIHFTAEAGKTVTVQYVTKPEAGVTYASTAACLNAIVFDEANPLTAAHDPYPANVDYHVDCDDGTCTLTWSAAEITPAKHHLMVGTASGAEKEVAVLAANDTCYTLKDMYALNKYYWRVDEEAADGTIGKGEEWVFQPRQLAFPGAEGYGRYAIGGRGGVVYHVTNLSNDMTPGSFIYGLKGMTGARTIVFDVSGIIDMGYTSIFTDNNITIAPQTAPGKGICLRQSSLNIGGDCIVRHLRAKRGYGGADNTGNALGVTGADHTILDHVTAAWGTDETFSSRGAKNITFQYNMIAEALGIADHKNYDSGTNHGYAATIGGDYGTFSHNMLVDCEGRNWSMGGGVDGAGNAAGELDMFNNVCYNWHKRTTDGGAKWMQFVNNYYKMGPASSITYLFSADNEGGDTRTQFAYVSGNIRENINGSLTQDKLGDTYRATGPEPEKAWVAERLFPSYATIHTAQEAFKIVTSDAGATMPCRDNQHLRVMNEAITGTYTYVGSKSGIKGEIDREADITGEENGGWEIWPEEQRAADYDSDQDGMPDWWEKITGSNPDVADNNDDPNSDGWTRLEDYLEFMAHPYLIIATQSKATFDMAQEFAGFTDSPKYEVEYDGSKLISPSVDGALLTVQTFSAGGMNTMQLKVTDADGTTYSKRFSVAVIGDTSAIDNIKADTFDWNDDTHVAKREFFTTDGKQTTALTPHEAYIMKVTDTSGKIHTAKILKN